MTNQPPTVYFFLNLYTIFTRLPPPPLILALTFIRFHPSQLSHLVCGCNYICPSFGHSLNNSTPQRPQCFGDSLRKLNSHSIAFLWSLPYGWNCWGVFSFLRHWESLWSGKSRNTKLKYMIGEIDRNEKEEAKKGQKNQEKKNTGSKAVILILLMKVLVLQPEQRGHSTVKKTPSANLMKECLENLIRKSKKWNSGINS